MCPGMKNEHHQRKIKGLMVFIAINNTAKNAITI